mmetsp:Transcript_27175/g.24056  ORF Transcript_27175/g.24056 Transcript_27175/m.24056 type:complete len:135 (+) Transcript_27175:654-1058(+)
MQNYLENMETTKVSNIRVIAWTYSIVCESELDFHEIKSIVRSIVEFLKIKDLRITVDCIQALTQMVGRNKDAYRILNEYCIMHKLKFIFLEYDTYEVTLELIKFFSNFSESKEYVIIQEIFDEEMVKKLEFVYD